MIRFNTGDLYRIFRDFYTLTNIRIVLIDNEFQELLSYPEEHFSFCSRIRKNSKIDASCMKSDKDACMKCRKSRELVLYQCHMGLMEAVVPICDKNGVIAYIMFGQILSSENQEGVKEQLRAQCQKEQFLAGAYEEQSPGIEKEMEEIPVKSMAELNAAATILQSLTSYVIFNHWVMPTKSDFIRQLDNYIEEHLGESITALELCEEFGIGKTRLYEAGSTYLGCGLMEYVRRQRIFHAQNMLRNTKLPVGEIAYAVGFSDYTHFSRIFKEMNGISAREYRKRENTSILYNCI